MRSAASLAMYEPNTREMRDAGLTIVGDQIEEQDDGSPMGTSRGSWTRAVPICGWFAAVPVKPAGSTGR